MILWSVTNALSNSKSKGFLTLVWTLTLSSTPFFILPTLPQWSINFKNKIILGENKQYWFLFRRVIFFWIAWKKTSRNFVLYLRWYMHINFKSLPIEIVQRAITLMDLTTYRTTIKTKYFKLAFENEWETQPPPLPWICCVDKRLKKALQRDFPLLPGECS